MNARKILPTVLSLWGAAVQAHASGDPMSSEWLMSRWRLTTAVAITEADITVVDSEVTFTDGVLPDDFTLELQDQVSVSSTIFRTSVGYRILPFVELNAHFGFIGSDQNSGVIATGTPDGPLGLITEPLSVELNTGTDASGYSWGVGAAGGAPLASIGDERLALRASYQYSWNRLDDGDIVSNASRTSVGLVYPANPDLMTFSVGASYNWLTREIEQSAVIGGTSFDALITQEFEDPWSIDIGVQRPLTDRLSVGLGTTHMINGETSFLAALTVRRAK